MTVIELSDDDAAALKTKATAAGLSLEAWLKLLQHSGRSAALGSASPVYRRRHSEQHEGCSARVMAKMPEDGATQHDHYIHGWPKREV